MDRCECEDSRCAVGHGKRSCQEASITLERSDMYDDSPLYFCEECAADAFDSGVFRIVDFDFDFDCEE